MSNRTIVVNAFGGPGSGKTTACFHIACELKKKGYVVEYVPEYSKELVWDKNWDLLDGSYEHQIEILKVQKHRLDRLIDQVDFIVTDAPLINNTIYLNDCPEKKEHAKYVLKLFKSYNNFICLVVRDASKYEQEGRLQNLNEAIEKDNEIKKLLDDAKLYYGTYDHKHLDVIVRNAIQTYNRLNKK
jgi:predicted ATPase